MFQRTKKLDQLVEIGDRVRSDSAYSKRGAAVGTVMAISRRNQWDYDYTLQYPDGEESVEASFRRYSKASYTNLIFVGPDEQEAPYDHLFRLGSVKVSIQISNPYMGQREWRTYTSQDAQNLCLPDSMGGITEWVGGEESTRESFGLALWDTIQESVVFRFGSVAYLGLATTEMRDAAIARDRLLRPYLKSHYNHGYSARFEDSDLEEILRTPYVGARVVVAYAKGSLDVMPLPIGSKGVVEAIEDHRAVVVMDSGRRGVHDLRNLKALLNCPIGQAPPEGWAAYARKISGGSPEGKLVPTQPGVLGQTGLMEFLDRRGEYPRVMQRPIHKVQTDMVDLNKCESVGAPGIA